MITVDAVSNLDPSPNSNPNRNRNPSPLSLSLSSKPYPELLNPIPLLPLLPSPGRSDLKNGDRGDKGLGLGLG